MGHLWHFTALVQEQQLLFLSFPVAMPKAVSTSPMNSDISFSLPQLRSGRSGKHLPEKRESLLEVMKKSPFGVLPLTNIWTDNSSSEKDRKSQGGLLERAGKQSPSDLVSAKGRKAERGCVA